MNRRDFLKRIGIAAATVAVAPLAMVVGKKKDVAKIPEKSLQFLESTPTGRNNFEEIRSEKLLEDFHKETILADMCDGINFREEWMTTAAQEMADKIDNEIISELYGAWEESEDKSLTASGISTLFAEQMEKFNLMAKKVGKSSMVNGIRTYESELVPKDHVFIGTLPPGHRLIGINFVSSRDAICKIDIG